MRYIIYGAGGVGGTIGGLLHAAGFETVLICRGPQLDAIQRQGLTVRTTGGDVQADIAAVGHPRELTLQSDDAVILTMKSQDTEQALLDLEAAGGADLPVICCQNGVENERAAARRYSRVYGMLVAMPATYMEPGVVVGWGTPAVGVLDTGCFPAGIDDFIVQVAADLTAAGFDSRAVPAIMPLKYAKLLDNLGNGVQALAQVHRSDARAGRLMAALRAEGIACYEAAGIDWLSEAEYRAHVGPRMQTGQIPGEERSGNSTWQSLARGLASVETDYLNGEIVLLGALYGKATPCNALIRRLTREMAISGRAPCSYGIDELTVALPV